MRNILEEHNRLQARRQFLKTSGMGLGVTALASLLPQNSLAQPAPDQTPRAKHVIFLFMAGAPSQIDLFDYKPDLGKLFKQPLPESISMGQRVTAMTKGQTQLIAPSMFQFHRQGQNGIWMSELLPHLSEVADDLCIINSMHTNAINHDPAKTFICTGSEIPGKASMGAWLSYGLGSMNRDLPDFIVLTSAYWTGGTRNVQALYSRLWGSGFLPSQHQGVAFQTSGDPVLFLSNPRGVDTPVRRRMLDALGQLNRKHFAEIGDPEIQTTIAQQELAFRMQASVPELTDISGESQHVMDLYGPEVHKNGSFARNCLLARRMVRARRTLRPDLSPRVGSPHDSAEAVAGSVLRCRSAVRSASERPETAWAARRYDRGSLPVNSAVQSTVRATWSTTITAAIIILAASQPGWPAVASRAGYRTVRLTISAITSCRIRWPSVTCMPPSCTSWASTTKN